MKKCSIETKRANIHYSTRLLQFPFISYIYYFWQIIISYLFTLQINVFRNLIQIHTDLYVDNYISDDYL